MKINPGMRTLPSDLKRSDKPMVVTAKNRSFSDVLQQNQQQTSYERLKQIVAEIHEQGERLAKSMTIRELRQYKRLVKHFLEETARRGVGIRESRGWDRRGRSKKYAILEAIDQKLLEMADELLESEEGRIQLLQSIGEVRGLLVNFLY